MTFHRHKAIYDQGERYVPDDIYAKIDHVKIRAAVIISSGGSIDELWKLLMLLPSDVE